MSKTLKWVIIILIIAVFTLLVYLSGVIFGKTLGFLPTFIIWGVISAIGWRWTHKGEEKDGGDGDDES